MQNKRAFTLIEVLVVLAIIGILSSMIFPSLSRAREGGRRASCQNNLRQIGMAVSMYTDDYDERYNRMENQAPFEVPEPVPAGCEKVIELPVPWSFPLLPYAKSHALFQCPSITKPPQSGELYPLMKLWDNCTYPPNGPSGPGGGGGDPISQCPVPKPELPETSYGFNSMMEHEVAWMHTEEIELGHGFEKSQIKETKCNVPPSAPGTTKAKLTHPMGVLTVEVKKPSETILITDSEEGGGMFIIDTQLDYPMTPLTGDELWEPGIKLAKRHLGGYNALFADGHVKFLPYGTSKPQMWSVEDD